MRLALMQPYFFPYLGHFELIAGVDRWVVFDTAQYIRRGWMNRNRILKPAGGWQYVNVPIERCPRDTIIADVRIAEHADWRSRLLRQLAHYRDKAPFFLETKRLVEQCLSPNVSALSRFNVHCLAKVCEALNIPFDPIYLSETGADPGVCRSPGERVLKIARNLGATTYVNPERGEVLLDSGSFEAAGLALEIHRHRGFEYDTSPFNFEPRLSVIDVLMWNAPEVVHERAYGRTGEC